MGLQLPRLIRDGMVLQRDFPVKLNGLCDAPVTVTFLGREYRALPGPGGAWEVTLDRLAPGGPHTMTINGMDIRDVYVGDVWLCSGQSNMQLPMQRVRHMYPEEMQSENPYIRQFTVPQRTSFTGPEDDLEGGAWAGASPGTIGGFSAVGYFFAKRLYQRYHVPIGLILSAIGGTPVHAWMGRDTLAMFPELIQEADLCADGGYVAGVQAQDERKQQEFFDGIDRDDPGLLECWQAPGYDDSLWEERPLLASWAGAGSVWLRKTIDIPAELAGKPATLFLGTVMDWDMVYVNGEAVGNTTYRYPPREYAIPALQAGRCVLTIRVISQDGGGFTQGKQYLLSTDSGAIDLNGGWKFRRDGHSLPATHSTFFHYKPTGLYNGMIAPLTKYAIKGALWYQGESDTAAPERYAEKFETLVRAWRKDWGYDFPFLFVELVHWSGGPDWDTLRQEQRKALRIPRTAMAAAYDLGEHNDLHPQNKQAVGDRLARCAMRAAYGEKLPPSPFEVVRLNE